MIKRKNHLCGKIKITEKSNTFENPVATTFSWETNNKPVVFKNLRSSNKVNILIRLKIDYRRMISNKQTNTIDESCDKIQYTKWQQWQQCQVTKQSATRKQRTNKNESILQVRRATVLTSV